VPTIDTVETPWGQRLIPVSELERFVREHLEPRRAPVARRPAGRPPSLPEVIVERIRLAYARGQTLAQIAQALTSEGVATAHGGRLWWPSTVRAVFGAGFTLSAAAEAVTGARERLGHTAQ
jgi:Recombinase